MSFDEGLILGLALGAGSCTPVAESDPDPDFELWQQLPDPAHNQFVSLIRVANINDDYVCYAWGQCDEGVVSAGSMPVTIDWGDGTIDNYDLAVDKNEQTGDPSDGAHSWYYTHIYSSPGDYIVIMTSGNVGLCSHMYTMSTGFRDTMAKFGDSIHPENYWSNGIAATGLSKQFLKYLKISSNTDFTKGTGYFSGFNYLRRIEYGGPPLTEIPNNTFSNCYALNIDNWDLSAVVTVGSSAFNSCYQLSNINLPNCETINYSAFSNCTNLSSINLPVCQTIDDYVFSSCNSLKSVTLNACTSVGQYAFYNCYSLTELYLPSCMNVGYWACAYDYSLVKTVFADGCTFDPTAFLYCFALYPIPT